MSQDPKSDSDPAGFGFSPKQLAALRKYVRLRLAGVPFLRGNFTFRNLTATVSTYDAEGNFVSRRPATEEEVKRWAEERRRLGLE